MNKSNTVLNYGGLTVSDEDLKVGSSFKSLIAGMQISEEVIAYSPIKIIVEIIPGPEAVKWRNRETQFYCQDQTITALSNYGKPELDPLQNVDKIYILYCSLNQKTYVTIRNFYSWKNANTQGFLNPRFESQKLIFFTNICHTKLLNVRTLTKNIELQGLHWQKVEWDYLAWSVWLVKNLAFVVQLSSMKMTDFCFLPMLLGMNMRTS